MSKQIRMACDVLDLLRQHEVITVGEVLETLFLDEQSIRQTLRVLADCGYAHMRGLAIDGRTKLYSAGPKLGGGQ